MPLRLLRFFLIFAALGWGVCIVGVYASWPQVNCIASGMGAKPIAYVWLPAQRAEVEVVVKSPPLVHWSGS